MYTNNPIVSPDDNYIVTARRAADFLFETCGGDFSEVPDGYAVSFSHNYENGDVSLLERIQAFGNVSDLSYEEWCTVRDSLIRQNPQNWAELDAIVALDVSSYYEKLRAEDVFEFSEKELNFEEGDRGEKMEEFLGKVLSTVYTDGVTSVHDEAGNPPSEENNFLMDGDGGFSGIFKDEDKEFEFQITKNGDKWGLNYKPTEGTREKLGG